MCKCECKCCCTPFNLRLCVDVIITICCSLIHLLMEGWDLYYDEDTKKRKVGEFVWFVIITVLGFLTQVVLFLKFFCCKTNGYFLRVFYGSGFMLLLAVSSVVTGIAWGKRPDNIDCTNKENAKTKECQTPAENSPYAQFGLEFLIFVLTLIAASCFLYAFILSYCKADKNETKVGSRDAEKGEGVDVDPVLGATTTAPTAPPLGKESDAATWPNNNTTPATNPTHPQNHQGPSSSSPHSGGPFDY